MALGARGREVAATVVRDVAVLVGAGTALGLVLSLLAWRRLSCPRGARPGWIRSWR